MTNELEQIPITVTYFTKTRVLYQKDFSPFDNFGSILSFFEENIKEQDHTFLKQKYFYNNTEIQPNYQLINLIDKNTNNSQILDEINFSIEIEEKKLNSQKTYKKILLPKLLNSIFSLYAFIPENGIIYLEQYPESITMKYKLFIFNDYSSYCNSPNALYISGGIFNYEIQNFFWIIDNNFYSITKKQMLFPKYNHSMIYIEYNNEKLILIIGGQDNKSFYYDIENNCFENYADLNGNHIRPTLLKIGDFLYCFSNMTEEKPFFEKTNLNKRKWEKIYPNYENLEVNNLFFGFLNFCGGATEKEILLFGGQQNFENSYEYNIENNMILVNKKIKNENLNLIDKNFYQVDENHCVSLPNIIDVNKIILVLNKNKKTFRKIKFGLDDKKIKLKNKINNPPSSGQIKISLLYKNKEEQNEKIKEIKNAFLNNEYEVHKSNKEEEFDVNEEEEEIDEPQIRDTFVESITQPLGQDIIQIEDFPKFHFENFSFCDYQV